MSNEEYNFDVTKNFVDEIGHVIDALEAPHYEEDPDAVREGVKIGLLNALETVKAIDKKLAEDVFSEGYHARIAKNDSPKLILQMREKADEAIKSMDTERLSSITDEYPNREVSYHNGFRMGVEWAFKRVIRCCYSVNSDE